jgi:hypothetical protein
MVRVETRLSRAGMPKSFSDSPKIIVESAVRASVHPATSPLRWWVTQHLRFRTRAENVTYHPWHRRRAIQCYGTGFVVGPSTRTAAVVFALQSYKCQA